MPTVNFEFVAPAFDTTAAFEALGKIRRLHRQAPVGTDAFVAAMGRVGPAKEWAWLDYLSTGDAARVALLQGVLRADNAPSDVLDGAREAMAELRRVAEERMGEALFDAS